MSHIFTGQKKRLSSLSKKAVTVLFSPLETVCHGRGHTQTLVHSSNCAPVSACVTRINLASFCGGWATS